MLHPKKVGTLPQSDRDEVKYTNEIGMVQALLDPIDIQGKTVTADALLTQRSLAHYLEQRGAHYLFTVKGNQPTLRQDIEFFFQDCGEPDATVCTPPDHGRIETRKVWATDKLNSYLDFPNVGQAFVIERHSINKKTGKTRCETAFGITSHTPDSASPSRLLALNRGHWCIENSCHYIIDWNFDEDRSRIRTGHGPENVSRLRRFAVSIIKSKGARSVAQAMRRLSFNVRLVLDYLRMTKNANPQPRTG